MNDRMNEVLLLLLGRSSSIRWHAAAARGVDIRAASPAGPLRPAVVGVAIFLSFFVGLSFDPWLRSRLFSPLQRVRTVQFSGDSGVQFLTLAASWF